MDFSFLSDPNFLQGMGNAGEAISRGEPMGVALNPADLIRQMQVQKAGAAQQANTQQLIQALLGGLGLGGVETGTKTDQGLLEGMSIDPDLNQFMGLPVTPKGSPGADSRSIQETADGTNVTYKIPSRKNLETYGTNVPAESIRAQPNTVSRMGGGVDSLPFFQALFSQKA